MILRKAIPILIVCSCLSPLALAQEILPKPLPLISPSPPVPANDFSNTVIPITDLKFLGLAIEGKFGTGFCLDPECRFIGTNYHVAIIAPSPKIKGTKVVQRYLATGPEDEDATVNDGPYLRPMKFTLSRDLAIFELRHSLLHHNGVAFSLDELQVGQEIDIYAYPKGPINPIRKLAQFHGTFKGQTPTGLLAFDYGLSASKGIKPGASGGLVVDSKTQRIVGILSGIAMNGEAIALAVPVQSLADFVSRVQPYLAQRIFPSVKEISPTSTDFYPKFVPERSDAVQHRPEESRDVQLLRSKAQDLADSIVNLIAVQSIEFGSGNSEPAAMAAYEVRVLDGDHRFREYPDGKKILQDLPLPPLNNVVGTGGEWSQLPRWVGTEIRLKIHQAPDVVVNERRIKVFQYRAEAEDRLCIFDSRLDFVFFLLHKIHTVACYGEAWTDEDTNILRISEHFELLARWKDYQGVVTYGWLRQKGEAPRRIPLTIYTQAELNKKVYWCRGVFTNYQVFSTNSRVVAYHPQH